MNRISNNKRSQRVKRPRRYQQLTLFAFMTLLILTIPAILIFTGNPDPALGALLLFPSLAYTSQLASASMRSARFRHWFRWLCLLGGIGYLFLWVIGLQGTKYFTDALLAATLGGVGLLYCFIVDLLTPSSNEGRVQEADRPNWIASHETGKLPQGVQFDPLDGISGMPASPGIVTVIVHEANTGMRVRKLIYSVYDLSKQAPQNTTVSLSTSASNAAADVEPSQDDESLSNLR
ncbi:hypothetical protein [Pseudarthrobacter niigatensis]|uniref:Uncharacterized protein n=1 Tax=Pseudarthrobacter niigatensis TaxID=369935 RepID=A0AAJ1WI86_9MICC|nr:hypothetical protein [Pseudarthrobacter niigatensis]MDQ0147313.1 hypothetical protein [Pseudarthrobacter niigatensis]MDQ0267130.1 hypothetical protein [Pseudarthrobacter niigatensis]